MYLPLQGQENTSVDSISSQARGWVPTGDKIDLLKQIMRKPDPQAYSNVYIIPNLYCGPNPELYSQTERMRQNPSDLHSSEDLREI